jgi:hypothetical protein
MSHPEAIVLHVEADALNGPFHPARQTLRVDLPPIESSEASWKTDRQKLLEVRRKGSTKLRFCCPEFILG